MSYGSKPFGLREVKLYSADGTGVVALPASMMLHLTPDLDEAQFLADGVGVGSTVLVQGLEWELEAGGISLEAYAKLTGQSITSAGTAPNRTQTLPIVAGGSLPYLRIHGRAIGDSGDGLLVKIYRCKLNSIEGTFRRGDFLITSCAGYATKHATLGLLDLVGQETQANL